MLAPRESRAARFDGLLGYTPYAVQLRYEADDAEVGSIDRGEALGQAEALLEEVRRRLTSEEGD